MSAKPKRSLIIHFNDGSKKLLDFPRRWPTPTPTWPRVSNKRWTPVIPVESIKYPAPKRRRWANVLD